MCPRRLLLRPFMCCCRYSGRRWPLLPDQCIKRTQPSHPLCPDSIYTGLRSSVLVRPVQPLSQQASSAVLAAISTQPTAAPRLRRCGALRSEGFPPGALQNTLSRLSPATGSWRVPASTWVPMERCMRCCRHIRSRGPRASQDPVYVIVKY